MYPIYYAVVIIVSIIALVSTIMIAKEMTKQEKKSSSKNEIDSLKNETKNSSIPMLTVIYSITFVLSIILIWIFIL
ncbi:hypothetical protein CEH05_03965 [Halobacillus halophilus]|uniref:Uncharacterized protein n=1 Tax=Halobacillus halophilus (strain ATCC 35676 / DSM 2266 / JCM 20832 / KCTC 3685 / LMG 17431 / NBRC 102448 / NCIMB 2269) TaxID=866895 RepID=I0JJ31_HALH3|nr:hypothetical protein [Halobacillus halophilus]ASF38315.1 hypothetical protein CEH05_03965 [Halobacillus halophilus]CCG44149.1 hypothetical protein HBHAL_1785 [Halobacillus halophilus DSM 2266]